MGSVKIKIQEFVRKLHQRKLVRGLLYTFLLLIPFAGIYIHLIEPRRVKISRLKISLKKIPKSAAPLRLVQISDLHFGPTNLSTSYLRRCVQLINDLKPDLVLMTGDFMQWDSKFAKPLAHILSSLQARLGIFASLGNHDYGVCHKGHPPTDPVDHEEVIRHFEEHGIRVLHNETVSLRNGDSEVRVVGLGDYWTPHFQPHAAFQSSEEKGIFDQEQVTILLSHNPDSLDHLQPYHFDIMLAGHVHGGQVSFPFIGPLMVPVKHRHLRRGLHRVHDRWLYTNRGLGYIFKARLLSHPEIACLDLVGE